MKKEYEVRLYYKACVKYKVLANNRNEAHKNAHAQFMDSPSNRTLSNSDIDNVNEFFIETVIDGADGSDMIH